MSIDREPPRILPTRRGFFDRVFDGFLGASLAHLLQNDLRAATFDLKPKPPHHPAKAKSIIHLFMNGGPSQVDLFDYKPALQQHAGQPPGRDLASEIRAVREAGGLMPSPFQFRKHGQAGTDVSELLPYTAEHV